MKKAKKGAPLGMGFWGFMAPEVATLLYALFTMLVIFFTWTNLDSPSDLLWMRLQYLSGTLLLWVVYLLWPCKAMIGARVAYLLAMLVVWYPDTYAINSQFQCLDHVFAAYEQSLFGFQPSLVFSKAYSSRVVSELMYMGYFSYYLFFIVTLVIVFFQRFKDLERASFMIFASFYICYVIYVLMPVTGPQYYYLAVGVEEIAHGNFPDVGHYFKDHMEALTSPGWSGGLFYNLVDCAHHAGERPTAAFPSSHVAIATLVMLISARLRMWRWLLILAIPFVFLCLSTVYIYAHYAIDAIAGLLFGTVLFFILGGMKLGNTKKISLCFAE
ncbi:MAG: phosphatase PAP2 family protein [Prevotella sp.]|nr:phosphatase PAP2 family protein [Prevotella sp.]